MVQLTDLKILRPKLRGLVDELFQKDSSDVVAFASSLTNLYTILNVYKNEVYAKYSARHRLPTAVISYLFTFLDLVGYQDAKQICSKWWKASQSSMLVPRIFRQLKNVVREDYKFGIHQTFIPSGDRLLLPWLSEAAIMTKENNVHFRNWAELGITFPKEDICILAKTDWFVVYEIKECLYLNVRKDISGIQTYKNPFKVHHRNFCLDGDKLYAITPCGKLYIYDLTDFPVKPINCEIRCLEFTEQEARETYGALRLCISKNNLYVFCEASVDGYSSFDVEIFCFDKVTFEVQLRYVIDAKYTDPNSLKDCCVENGLFFWGGKSCLHSVYVVYDSFCGNTYYYFTGYTARAILWNAFVVLHSKQGFLIWDSKFTKSTKVFKERYGCLIFNEKIV